MEGILIRELKQSHDDRRWLVEIFGEDEFNYDLFMSYVLMPKPAGEVRHEDDPHSPYGMD
jgi:hypothetical protein